MVGVDLAEVFRAVIAGGLAAVHGEDRLPDDRERALERAEGGVLEGPLHAGTFGARRLDAVGVHELGRRRAEHLERPAQQPALRTVRDLGAADGLERLAVGAPQGARRGPYPWLEQKRMRPAHRMGHACIMARGGRSRYGAPHDGEGAPL